MHLKEGLLPGGAGPAGLAGAIAVLKHEAAAEGGQVRVVGGRAVGDGPARGGGGQGGRGEGLMEGLELLLWGHWGSLQVGWRDATIQLAPARR